MITNRSRYSHITFADKINLSRRPVDFAPGVPSSDDDEFDASLQGDEREFMSWLLERAGVSVMHYRPETLARRLPACLRMLRANSPAHARAILERNDQFTAGAIDAVLIGVTSFFRDQRVFDDLDAHVLPQLVDRGPARVWSAGCSDGMELYSVAIQLAERRILHRCFLLGTDCRVESTRTAATGVFARQALCDLPDGPRKKYFHAIDGNSVKIDPIIRGQIQWRTADVLRTPEPGPWDLILCRNMAMYMRGDAVARLWEILHSSLRPGGHLVLGKAERPSGACGLSMVAPCVYRREK